MKHLIQKARGMTRTSAYMGELRLLMWFLLGCTLFLGGWALRGLVADKEMSDIQKSHLSIVADQQKTYIEAVVRRDMEYNVLVEKLHRLDTKHVRRFNEKLEENERLRNSLRTARGMRFKGASCPRPSTGTVAHAEGGSLGDGAGVELTAEARRDVFDLRSMIIQDQEKLSYLQAYLKEAGLAE
jgi:prophage endopeptidase